MNKRLGRVACAVLVCVMAAAAAPVHAASDCPADIARADQLILVLAESMDARTANVRYYERGDGKDKAWRQTAKTKPAMLGKSGLGWSWAHEALAAKDEPVKTEGDGRTPGGFFTVGGAFGSNAGSVPNYTTLSAGEHYCVDDPASPHYNTVTTKAKAGKGVSGEEMARIGLYRQGLFLNYPTNAGRKGGSCIFVHVWRAPNKPTVGCVALAEADVKDMQRWSAKAATLMAILPARAWEKLRGCLPDA
ncbi:MAG: L,D-transpeptidase family protein [Rhodomicrobiaceae bacterium]